MWGTQVNWCYGKGTRHVDNKYGQNLWVGNFIRGPLTNRKGCERYKWRWILLQLVVKSWWIKKMDYVEIGCEDGRWLVLVQGRVQWWALVLVVLSCQVLLPKSICEVLSSVLSTSDTVHCRQLWALAVCVPMFWSRLVLVGTCWSTAFRLMGSYSCNTLTRTFCSPGEWQLGTLPSSTARHCQCPVAVAMKVKQLHKSNFRYFYPLSLLVSSFIIPYFVVASSALVAGWAFIWCGSTRWKCLAPWREGVRECS